ncbi:MAG: hypothetical protein IBX56_10510 [Methylomicrobium sp.]|nr:hypothetical protein [Methylomicrobium sp.]
MAKDVKQVKPENREFKMTLDEFCARLSQDDKRVELIGGFHFSEKRAKRLNDTESAYRVRFEEFLKTPV